MTAFDRRQFLRAAAVAGIVGATSAAGAARPTAEGGWQYRNAADLGSSFAHARRTDDGYLFVGGARDEEFTTEGLATALAVDGGVAWSDRYLSPQQRDARDQEIATGPIPEDWLSFSLETDDGFLLVGWTYYDNTAVDIARVYRTGASGAVEADYDLGDLEGASAYSHLADGVETDDGFLCCGIESPGISLGGAGWLVWLDDDGAPTRHERYPASERDLETTSRRDVFNAITASDGGYVVGGAFEPESGGPAQGWVVGLDEEGAVRWDDRFALEGSDEATVVYDVRPSESDEYEFLVVGATGANLQRADATRFDVPPGDETRIGGDGFVAAYTDDGEQRWLETLADTPLFCAETTPRGVVAGGARDGRAWVGTVSRTAFHADRESVVASLCPSHGEGLIAAGRVTDGERVEAWVRALEGIESDGKTEEESERRDDEPTDRDDEPTDGHDDEETDGRGDDETKESTEEEADDDTDGEVAEDGGDVEFLDCRRVRVVGEFDDVILSLVFEADDGMPGTITEPVGGVDGERVIDGAAEFGLPVDATVLTGVELFEDVAVATPGLGDRFVENPDLEACERETLGDVLERRSADSADPDDEPSEGEGTDS